MRRLSLPSIARRVALFNRNRAKRPSTIRIQLQTEARASMAITIFATGLACRKDAGRSATSVSINTWGMTVSKTAP